jgi:photosystem II stability/assembly factor-like uncharacterized protein
MGIKEELNEALQADDFPSSSLLQRTMMRLDEPVPASKRWQALAGVAAVLLAGFVVGAIRLAHVGHHPVQPVTSQPALSLSSAQEGLMSYRFVTPQVGWVSVFQPDGQTVVAKTSDGGKHWEHQFRLEDVFPGLPADFLNASIAIIGGQQQGIGPEGSSPTTLPAVLWVTTDGGAHWEMRAAPADSGALMSVDFIDAEHGWLMTSQGSTVFLFQTTDGGRQWTRVATSETSPALATSEVRTELKFVSPTVGWIILSPSRLAGGDLYVTRDGGRIWSLENRPAAGVGKPGSRVSMNLPRFFNERDGVVQITVSSSSRISCPAPSSSSGFTTVCFQPIGTYVSVTGDGGQSWSAPRRITMDASLTFIDARQWIARGDNGISTSTDAGVSWSAPRPLPQLPAGWGPNQVELLDLKQGWISVEDSPEGEGRRIAIYGAAPAGSTGPMHIRISGTAPRFALLATDDEGVHWTEVQLAGID